MNTKCSDQYLNRYNQLKDKYIQRSSSEFNHFSFSKFNRGHKWVDLIIVNADKGVC